MRILVRTSIWAIWASRLAALALPLAVIPVLLHRARMLDSQTFLLIEFGAAILALLALLLSFGALVRLWQRGDRGWGRAVSALLIALFCLAPFAAGAVLVGRYPSVTDVSTDRAAPLRILSPHQKRPVTPALEAAVEAAFPNLRTRNYPVGAAEVFALVERLALARGWDLGLRRLVPGEGEPGEINAIVTTALGWRDEVAIRVAETEGGASVDMRSVSLAPAVNDLGTNGRRIEEFLLALDAEVTLLLRDGAPVEPEPEAVPGESVAPVPATR